MIEKNSFLNSWQIILINYHSWRTKNEERNNTREGTKNSRNLDHNKRERNGKRGGENGEKDASLTSNDRIVSYSSSFPYVSKFLHPFFVLLALFLFLLHSVLVPRSIHRRFSSYKQPGKRNRTSASGCINSARWPDDWSIHREAIGSHLSDTRTRWLWLRWSQTKRCDRQCVDVHTYVKKKKDR